MGGRCGPEGRTERVASTSAHSSAMCGMLWPSRTPQRNNTRALQSDGRARQHSTPLCAEQPRGPSSQGWRERRGPIHGRARRADPHHPRSSALSVPAALPRVCGHRQGRQRLAPWGRRAARGVRADGSGKENTGVRSSTACAARERGPRVVRAQRRRFNAESSPSRVLPGWVARKASSR